MLFHSFGFLIDLFAFQARVEIKEEPLSEDESSKDRSRRRRDVKEEPVSEDEARGDRNRSRRDERTRRRDDERDERRKETRRQWVFFSGFNHR